MALSVLVPSSSQTVLIPALPVLVDERGYSAGTSGWLLSAFLVGASLASPLVGRLGDLRGRRLLAVLVSAAYVLGSGICLAAGDHGGAMSLGRALQGFSAGVFVLHIAGLQQIVPDRAARAVQIGLLSGVVATGPAIGFVVGGVLTAHVGVDAIFVLGIGVGLLSTLSLWLWLPDSGGEGRGALDVPGAVAVALVLAGLLAFLTELGVSGPLARSTLAALGLTVLAAVALVRALRRATTPLLDLAVLRNRVGVIGNLASIWSAAAMYGLFVAVPQLVQDRSEVGLGLGPVAAGLVLVPGALGMVLAGPVAGRLGALHGYGPVIVVGNLLCTAGMLGLVVAPWSLTAVLLLATVAGVGVGVAFPALPSVVMAAVPPADVGTAAGLNSLARGLGSAVGAQVVLIVSVAWPGGPAAGHLAAFATATSCAAVAAVLGLVVSRVR
ncbi:MFS transporter [Ornithinimicrobium humiphilum]